MSMPALHQLHHRLAIAPLGRWLLLCACLMLANSAHTNEDSSPQRLFRVGCPLPPQAIMLRPLEDAFQEALALTNARVQFLPFPEPRALALLYRGELDGICGISEYAQKNLQKDKGILLKTPIALLRMVAVYDPEIIELDKQQLFRNSRYKIGYAESGTARQFLKSQRYSQGRAITNLPQTGAVLKSQRINVLIGLDVMLFNLAFQRDFGRFQYEVLATQNAYPVIHPRHQLLEDELNQKLADLVKRRHGPISLPNLDNWQAP